MPGIIDQLYVDTFNANLVALAQQEASVLRNRITSRGEVGDNVVALEQYGSVAMEEKLTRFAATPQTDTPYDRRWCNSTPWNQADYVDDLFDLEKMLQDPRSAIARTHAFAAGRKMDKTIVDAMLGTASTGQSPGDTPVALPAAQQIAAGGTGLTLDKIREAYEKLSDANVDMTGACIVMTPKQHRDLLEQVVVTSADYVSGRPTETGTFGSVYGFDLLVIGAGGDANEAIMPDTGTVQSAVAFTPNSTHLGIWQEPLAQVDMRHDLSNIWQIYTKMRIGATRLEEVRVVQIDTLKAA